MAGPSLEELTKPISADDPCGPDLELDGDPDYLNFLAAAGSALPQSYFRAREASGGELRLFDPKMIAIGEHLAAAEPLIAKTRDIRLVVLIAKLLILNRDLAGFVTCLRSLAVLLSEHWDDVHPRSEDGDFTFRGVALEAIDVIPTVTMPLQFMPITQSRRFGPVSYRTYLTAQGRATATEGEASLDAATVERVLEECELDDLVLARQQIADILTTLQQIGETWATKSGTDETLGFSQLSELSRDMAFWLDEIIRRRDPAAMEAFASDAEAEPQAADAVASGASQIGSIAGCASALDAVALYFARYEPSSPARLLILQSQQLLGKSFVEVLQILVPTHVEQAALRLGRNGALELPLLRMTEGRGLADFSLEEGEPAGQSYDVTSRAQALGIIDQVSAYFKSVEPSSPIPMLLDRTRDFGQKDFLSLLQSVLPSDALRSPDAQQ